VEKSPENVVSAAPLRRLKGAYPRARYLHLTRHPVTTQSSMIQHRHRSFASPPADGEPMEGIAAWLDAHLRILSFTSKLPQESAMKVRAEDVLNDPRPHLRAIADWLGLQTDETSIEAMRHPERSPFARPGRAGSGILGGHDPNFLRDPFPRRVEVPPALEKPPGWQGEMQLWQAAVEVARHLGY